MEISIEYKTLKAKLDITNINDWNSLINSIRTILKIEKDKKIEIYSLPKNIFLTENNFEEDFKNVKKEIKGISIQEEIDLAEKIKNIGVPLNRIDSGEEEDLREDPESIELNNKQQKHEFKDKCSLCKKDFENSKYKCIFCTNYFLCYKCAENHPHMMIKHVNDKYLSNLNKILDIQSSGYIKENEFLNRIKNKYKFKDIYKLGLRTNISSNSFAMGNNQTREINLLIKNNNNFPIPKDKLNIFIKNQYDLNIMINDDYLHKEITPQIEIPIKLTITSNNKSLLEIYNLRIEVFSDNMDIYSIPLILKITIKNDEEDDVLNKQFSGFPSIVLLPKEKKKKLEYIVKEKLSIKTPSEIKSIMEKFKWNIEAAINDLIC